MDIRFHSQLYRDGISDHKLKSIQKKIKKKSAKLNLFLVTLPVGNQGILEVYWYPELLQPFFKNMNKEVIVVGIADSRENAFDLVKKIIQDVGIIENKIPITEYFKE